MNAIHFFRFKKTFLPCFVFENCTKLTFENVPDRLSFVSERVWGGAV